MMLLCEVDRELLGSCSEGVGVEDIGTNKPNNEEDEFFHRDRLV
jgi:hypothetical protein